MSEKAIYGHQQLSFTVVQTTNVKVDRKDVLSQAEIDNMFQEADRQGTEFFILRAKACISLLRPGKRRSEVAMLELSDLETDEAFLRVTYTVVKKRKKTLISRRRTKKFPLSSRYAHHILAYRDYILQHYPKCKYLFPSAHSAFGHWIINLNAHANDKQIYRIVKALDPNAWPHLFRETRGADVVRDDERKQRLSPLTVYRVQASLDLEKETTAWNYIRRFATETIEDEEASSVSS